MTENFMTLAEAKQKVIATQSSLIFNAVVQIDPTVRDIIVDLEGNAVQVHYFNFAEEHKPSGKTVILGLKMTATREERILTSVDSSRSWCLPLSFHFDVTFPGVPPVIIDRPSCTTLTSAQQLQTLREGTQVSITSATVSAIVTVTSSKGSQIQRMKLCLQGSPTIAIGLSIFNMHLFLPKNTSSITATYLRVSRFNGDLCLTASPMAVFTTTAAPVPPTPAAPQALPHGGNELLLEELEEIEPPRQRTRTETLSQTQTSTPDTMNPTPGPVVSPPAVSKNEGEADIASILFDSPFAE
jgi:hypothetical protein